MMSTVLGLIAVAFPMRWGWPAKLPSPKKSPGPRMAMIASLPLSLTAVILTPPSRMYMTLEAGAPCEKMVSALLNSWTFLATPAESRNACALNAAFFLAILFDVFWLGLITALIGLPAYSNGSKTIEANSPFRRGLVQLMSRRA